MDPDTAPLTHPYIRDDPYIDPYLSPLDSLVIHQAVDLSALRAAVVAPVISPLPTLVALLGQALHEPGRERARALRARDAAALAPLRTAPQRDGSGGRPNEIVPVLPGGRWTSTSTPSPPSTPTCSRATSTRRCARATRPARGAPVAADPARWLRTYVTALRRAWTVVRAAVGALGGPARPRGGARQRRARPRRGAGADRRALPVLRARRRRAAAAEPQRQRRAACASAARCMLQPLLAPPPAERLDGRLRATPAWRSATRSRTRGAPSTAGCRSPPRWTALLGPHRARILAAPRARRRRPRASSPGSCTASRAWRAITCARSSTRGS